MENNLADHFLLLSENYLKSAIVLWENIGRISPASHASFWFCIGHSIELSLKAFLLILGANKAGVIKYGHNLESFLDEALEQKLELQTDTIFNIRLINEFYKKHDFRYPNKFGETITMPFECDLISNAQETFAQVEKAIKNAKH